MKDNWPQRKHPRLKNNDYREDGFYFITICTKNRNRILSTVGRDANIPPSPSDNTPTLTDIGIIVDKYIKNIDYVYAGVSVKKYVIMPDHIHILILMRQSAITNNPTSLHTIVRSLKTLVTKNLGYSIWQSSYYDKVLRENDNCQPIVEFIDNNPQKWWLNNS